MSIQVNSGKFATFRNYWAGDGLVTYAKHKKGGIREEKKERNKWRKIVPATGVYWDTHLLVLAITFVLPYDIQLTPPLTEFKGLTIFIF